MTVHLDWPADVVARLIEEARQRGLSLDAYLLEVVSSEGIRNGMTEAAARAAREEAGRRIRDLRQGNVLGPELTIRDLIEEGRRL